MKCPYCGSEVQQVCTGYGWGELYVDQCTDSNSPDPFDSDISMFQCVANKKHIFYADNGSGNSQESLPEFIAVRR